MTFTILSWQKNILHVLEIVAFIAQIFESIVIILKVSYRNY